MTMIYMILSSSTACHLFAVILRDGPFQHLVQSWNYHRVTGPDDCIPIQNMEMINKITPPNLAFLPSTDEVVHPLNANPTKWSNTVKQFVGKLPTNIWSVFGHFVILVLKGLSVWEVTYLERRPLVMIH